MIPGQLFRSMQEAKHCTELCVLPNPRQTAGHHAALPKLPGEGGGGHRHQTVSSHSQLLLKECRDIHFCLQRGDCSEATANGHNEHV